MIRYRRKPKRLESDIKRSIISYLNCRGWYVWNNRNVGVWDAKRGGYIPAPVKGVPDIIGYTEKGQFAGIEVKRPKMRTFIEGVKQGKHLLTKEGQHVLAQLEFLKHINEHGGVGLLIYSLEEIMQYYEGRYIK